MLQAETEPGKLKKILENLNVQDKFNKRAKSQWSKIYNLVCNDKNEIPLKQMALKAKHE